MDAVNLADAKARLVKEDRAHRIKLGFPVTITVKSRRGVQSPG